MVGNGEKITGKRREGDRWDRRRIKQHNYKCRVMILTNCKHISHWFQCLGGRMRRQIIELLVDVHVDGATLDNNMLQASDQKTSISHSPAHTNTSHTSS